MSTAVNNVLNRTRAWWSDLRCEGSIDYLTKSEAIALNLLPASGLDVGLVDPNQLVLFKCSKWSKQCQRCSCVKTMRKLFPGSCDWDRYLDVFISAKQCETNRNNRDGKAAEVDNADVHMRDGSGPEFRISRGDPHLKPIHVPVAPGVEDAQDGPHQSHSQRASLKDCRVHQYSPLSFSHYQRGHVMAHPAFNWLLAALICLLLGSLYRLDTPSDTQARIDTAQHTQDSQREAARQARFERAARRMCGGGDTAFVLLADNAIQCLSQGRKTITAKVAL